jgi:hypothetical protein
LEPAASVTTPCSFNDWLNLECYHKSNYFFGAHAAPPRFTRHPATITHPLRGVTEGKGRRVLWLPLCAEVGVEWSDGEAEGKAKA